MVSPEEESLLLAALRRANARSAFWSKRFREIGINGNDFKKGFNFQLLPLITKRELLEDQAEYPPFGSLLAVPEKEIIRIHKTSGTTAMPFIITLTKLDIEDTYTASKRAYLAAGLSQTNRIVHCLNFNMWSGGITDYMALEEVGATAIPYGVGNTRLLLNLIQKLKINSISATPSYMFTLRDKCSELIGIEPQELGLNFGFFGGEGLLQVPGVRDEIEKDFDMIAYDANYGMSEVLSIVGGEGQKRNGLIFHCHGVLHVELVNSDLKPVAIRAGSQGELVFSSLRREGQPLFRYRTNDIAKVLAADLGDDGLLRMRFKIIGRTDEMLNIKGINFFPQSLLSVITEFGNDLSREFRIMRPKADGSDTVMVVLESTSENKIKQQDIEKAFIKRVSELLQIQVKVKWFKFSEKTIPENKTRYTIEKLTQI